MQVFEIETGGDVPAAGGGGAAPDANNDAQPSVAAESSTPASPDAKPAATDSSTEATGEKRPTSTLDAVMKALEKPEAKVAPTKTEGDGSPPSGEQEKGDKPGPDDAETETYEPIKDAKRPVEHRLNKLLEERKQTLPNAQRFEALQKWTRDSGLNQDQFMTGLNLMAQMVNDPKKALEAITPILTQLKRDAGVVDTLPDDLQAQVDEGRVSDEIARELAEQRLLRENGDRREQQRRETEQQRRQQEHEQALTKQAAQTFLALDAEQVSKDPDFALKRPLVLDALALLRAQHGVPISKEDAAERFRWAVARVNQNVKPMRPTQKAIVPLPAGNRTTSVSPAPKTSLDVVERTYQQSRGT